MSCSSGRTPASGLHQQHGKQRRPEQGGDDPGSGSPPGSAYAPDRPPPASARRRARRRWAAGDDGQPLPADGRGAGTTRPIQAMLPLTATWAATSTAQQTSTPRRSAATGTPRLRASRSSRASRLIRQRSFHSTPGGKRQGQGHKQYLCASWRSRSCRAARKRCSVTSLRCRRGTASG